MRKTLFVACAAVAALSVPLCPARSTSLTGLTHQERTRFGAITTLPDSICVLIVHMPDGQQGMGNAFLIDAQGGWYATAAHMFNHVDAAVISFPELQRQFRVLPGLVIDEDDDIAFFHAPVPIGIRPVTLSRVPPVQGEVLIVLGYQPIDQVRIFGFQRMFLAVDQIDEDPFIPAVRFDFDSVGGLIGVAHGLSGSPVFTRSGAVVGIVSQFASGDPDGRAALFSPLYRVISVD